MMDENTKTLSEQVAVIEQSIPTYQRLLASALGREFNARKDLTLAQGTIERLVLQRNDAEARVGNYQLLLKNAEKQRDQWKDEVGAANKTITFLMGEKRKSATQREQLRMEIADLQRKIEEMREALGDKARRRVGGSLGVATQDMRVRRYETDALSDCTITSIELPHLRVQFAIDLNDATRVGHFVGDIYKQALRDAVTKLVETRVEDLMSEVLHTPTRSAR